MKKMFNNRFAGLLLAFAVAVVSCTKDNLTDGDKFMLFYPDITDIGPSTDMILEPTYHGDAPSDFKVYAVKLNGTAFQTDCFTIEAESGRLMIKNTKELAIGVYSISISCVSGGTFYEFPDIVNVNMMKPVPDGISVDPSEIVLLLTQVNNVNSIEELPTARVVTDGNHISIKSYRIANVTRDGVKMEDWSDFFSIDAATGVITIVKNGTFVAGKYLFDLRLVTAAVNAASEEGLFAGAFTVDIVSPPVSLSYDPEVKRVEEGTGYVSNPPRYVASSKNLMFELKAVYPENVPLTIDQATGALTLAAENDLVAGDEVQISIKVTNAYGTKDFDQVTRIDIVDFIQPISKLSYNDSTVWHGTAYEIKPIEVDGDDVKFSFVDLPEALAELSIDELTGKISTVKGNKIAKGEYTVIVRVTNDKGEMTENILLTVVDNPYFFTKVSWGNNLGLTPVGDYASQHRVTTLSENSTIPLDKTLSDITEEGWKNISFEIAEGSLVRNTDTAPSYAAINATTGVITIEPNPIYTRAISYKRVHVVIVKITVGEGTSGETVKRVPVFFDFNAPRQDASNTKAPVYTVEYTPFAFQCNPKTGGVFPAPVIKDADGNPISDADYSKITMTFMRNPNYYNVEGPESHISGPSKTQDTFLYQMWQSYYMAATGKQSSSLDNVIPLYNVTATDKTRPHLLGYIQDNLKLYIAPEKWKDADGVYADGVFEAQVIMGYPYVDNGVDAVYSVADKNNKGLEPYRWQPFLVWFDTEF